MKNELKGGEKKWGMGRGEVIEEYLRKETSFIKVIRCTTQNSCASLPGHVHGTQNSGKNWECIPKKLHNLGNLALFIVWMILMRITIYLNVLNTY